MCIYTPLSKLFKCWQNTYSLKQEFIKFKEAFINLWTVSVTDQTEKCCFV